MIEIILYFQDNLFTRHNKVSSVIAMAVSGNNRHIALYMDTGHLYMGTIDFNEKYCEHYTNMKEPLENIAWLICLYYLLYNITIRGYSYKNLQVWNGSCNM